MDEFDHDDVLGFERELCARSLSDFAQQAWHVLEPTTPLKWGWALDAICQHLEAVTDGRINRLLMNVPPGTMKSLLTGVIWPAWEWGPRGLPEMRFVGTAHEETLAIRDSRKCRDLIKSEWFQERWPLPLDKALDGKREFGNMRKGVRQARSFTSMTGVRGDRIILDDALSAHAANSESALENARVAFTETLPTRINSDKSAIVVIMQRLHEKDTSGVILEMGLPYVHLCIPMRFEPDNRCTTSIGWTDPRSEAGELMFPERFNEQQVQELERTLGSYGAAGQLQQRPAPRGGGLFKDSWWQYWRALPEITHRSIYADTAQKTKTQNDYSVFQCWGRTVNNKAVLIDQIRGKWEAPELLMQARAFWAKHRAVQQCGVLRAMRIEDKSSGTGLIQTLAREGIPVAPIQRSADKVSRAMDIAPLIEAGHVIIPADAPWLSEYLGEFSRFPTGAHDDQIDPTMDAVADMLQNSAHGYAVGKGSNHR